MKKVFVLIGILALASCTITGPIIEDNLLITKKYVGNFVSMETEKVKVHLLKETVTKITTTEEQFYIYGQPKIDIKEGEPCYVKYFQEGRPGSISVFFVLYFTWGNNPDYYQLLQDQYTGYIY
jgi:hypothetical protein